MNATTLARPAKATKLFVRHMATLKSGTVGESFIRGLRMALQAADRRRRGYSTSTTAPTITAQEARDLLAAVAANPPRIEPRQAAKGLAWLQRRAVQKELGNREREIVADFDHFTLSDMWDAGTNGLAFMLPVYTVHAKDGRRFSYYAGSWQSGVPLSVIS